jgi:hypothetical protein
MIRVFEDHKVDKIGSDIQLSRVGSPSQSDSSAEDFSTEATVNTIRVSVAAIDHGYYTEILTTSLAFPTHHPNRVRSYPYGWMSLPIAHTPFSKSTADLFLPYLTSSSWWDSCMTGLEAIFAIDSDFKPHMFAKQKGIGFFNLSAGSWPRL